MNWLQNYIKTLDVKEYLHYMDEIIYKQKYPESISLCKTPKEHWVKFGIKENKLFYFSKKFNTSDLYKNILKNHKHTLRKYFLDKQLVIQKQQRILLDKQLKEEEQKKLKYYHDLLNKKQGECKTLLKNKYTKYTDNKQQFKFKIPCKLNSVHKTIQQNFICFVPYCDVYYPYIIECLQSIDSQMYSNYKVIIVNDGGKKTDIIYQYIKDKAQYHLVHSDENNGPSHSKWLFYEYNQQNINNYSYSDICIIIDGDDTIRDNTFEVINKVYLDNNCWTTYGNAEGKFCNIENSIMPEGNIRLEKWRYNHPRTFKLFLIQFLQKKDFLYKGKWLTKGTDRPIVYNNLELSGIARVKFNDIVLYDYREHDQCSYKTVNPNYKKEQILYLNHLSPKVPIVEDIHVIMCSWKRVCNLKSILTNLNTQTVKERIHFHILNNNIDEIETIKSIIEYFKKSNCYIKITHTNYDNTYAGFQRFIYVKEVLLKKYIINYVIIIDDDHYFQEHWIERLYAIKKPKHFICWYGKIFSNNSTNYWKPIYGMPYILKDNKNNSSIKNFHYGGTGGSVIDINIFNHTSMLWNIPTNCNVSIYNIEDLWLSFVVSYYYGWTIKRSFLPVNDYTNTVTQENALYLTLRNEKQVLLEYLQKTYKWIR